MSELDLQQLASEFKLKIQVLPTQVILVYSRLDHWLLERGKGDMLLLKHFNNPRVSFKTHNQMAFKHITYETYRNIFSYISSHDHSMLHSKSKAM